MEETGKSPDLRSFLWSLVQAPHWSGTAVPSHTELGLDLRSVITSLVGRGHQFLMVGYRWNFPLSKAVWGGRKWETWNASGRQPTGLTSFLPFMLTAFREPTDSGPSTPSGHLGSKWEQGGGGGGRAHQSVPGSLNCPHQLGSGAIHSRNVSLPQASHSWTGANSYSTYLWIPRRRCAWGGRGPRS